MRRSYLHAALLLPLLALAQIQLTQAQTGYPDTHPAAKTEPGSRPDLVRYDQDTVCGSDDRPEWCRPSARNCR